MTTLLLSGCATTTVSVTEACIGITEKSDQVTLSRKDTRETIQRVGELLYVIETVWGDDCVNI